MPIPSRPLAASELLAILQRTEPHTLIAAGATCDPGRVAVRALPPDPRCGAAALFGIRAPAGSCSVGASFVGRATLDGRAAGDVRVDVVVHRDGAVESTVGPAGPCGSGGAGGAVAPPGPVERGADGRIVDALHRVLGLASPGRPPALDRLVVGLWMDRIVGGLADGARPTWARVAAVHPSLIDDADPAPPRVPPSPEVLAGLTGAVTAGASWGALRRSAVAGRLRVPELDPAEASWMDATLFARWTVESFPPPPVVLAALRDRGAVDAADRVRAALRLLPSTTGLA
jgi:hypothetical protein